MDSSSTTEAASVRHRIIHAHIDRLKEHGHPPLAVYPFCKSLDIADKGFFKEFPNLDAVESAFWRDQVAHIFSTGEIAERGQITAFFPDAIFTAFRNLIEFNIHDKTQGFERTDAYIEKSVQLAFELIRSQAIDSAFNLARFIAPQARR